MRKMKLILAQIFIKRFYIHINVCWDFWKLCKPWNTFCVVVHGTILCIERFITFIIHHLPAKCQLFQPIILSIRMTLESKMSPECKTISLKIVDLNKFLQLTKALTQTSTSLWSILSFQLIICM